MPGVRHPEGEELAVPVTADDAGVAPIRPSPRRHLVRVMSASDLPTYVVRHPLSNQRIPAGRAAMKIDAPIAVVAARYGSLDLAVADFDAVWGARHDGDFHHTAIAVLDRDSAGALHVERRNNTARHLQWGGALLGAPLFLLAPDTGAEVLAAVGLSGAGAIACHVRLNVSPVELASTAHLVNAGAYGLVVVVVNRRSEAVTPVLTHADQTASVGLVWGDLEDKLSRDFATPMSDQLPIAV
jgi:hypothetical protein